MALNRLLRGSAQSSHVMGSLVGEGMKNFFPKNPKDLLPGVLRDRKGYIYASDKIRIKPEQHSLQNGEVYNHRHHGQHYSSLS